MQTRRSILAAIVALAAAGAPAGCGGAVDKPPAPPPPAAPASNASPANTNAKDRINLVFGPGWRVRVRPVFSSTALDDGEGVVTVEGWEDGPSSVRYEFPAVGYKGIDPTVVADSVGVLRPKPVAGTISVPAASRSARVFTPPAFWQGGEATAPGPLLWLPPGVLAELKEKREATLAIAPLPNGLLMKGKPAADPGPARLTFVKAELAVLPVNGERLRLPALRLTDDRGATYSVLDSEQNPLVVQFRFGKETVVGGRALLTAQGAGYDVVEIKGP